MILLIDAGNTRVKWGLFGNGAWQDEGALEHARVGELNAIAQGRAGITRVFGSNVAGAGIAAAIAHALHGQAPAPEWLRSSAACCGVRNAYDEPDQLGTDRWAALIGARALHPAACLVINAGTATTIDILDADGLFRGGLILPGEHLMRRSLARDTAQLPFAEGRYVEAPRNTADAIVSGCRNAQAGAVERMFRQIADEPRAVCLLSGGGADALAELLAIPFRRVDNLVLKGLAVAATQPDTP
ncbi:type III pantothenate kinase [Aromatoleum toluclasticum]|uniref:type III pantothenate kinase n=1 Tax=Aromatoleum toluclasticum TaxID=92003 RepID=UPI001D1932AA|nr:type III pantothenate kinase [Aromatoleum toluclasticum]MCC4115009.1 type III pantothenate kinase [Aromatoleum toluclasticum]